MPALSFGLLFLLADAAIAPYNMERFASTTVKIDTGFEVDTIQYIWDKYNAIHGSPVGKRLTRPSSFSCSD